MFIRPFSRRRYWMASFTSAHQVFSPEPSSDGRRCSFMRMPLSTAAAHRDSPPCPTSSHAAPTAASSTADKGSITTRSTGYRVEATAYPFCWVPSGSSMGKMLL